MKTLLLLIALTLLAHSVVAQECPRPVVLSEPSSTPELAAIYAFSKILLHGQNVEYGGAILSIDGSFHITNPITQLSRIGVTYCWPEVPGWRLVGVYHSHAGKALYSDRDIENADSLGVPSFLVGSQTGTVKRYDPETGQEVTIGTIELTGPDSFRFSGAREYFDREIESESAAGFGRRP